MTIRDYLSKEQTYPLKEMDKLIKEFPKDEILSQEELIELHIELVENLAEVYNKGFQDAVNIIKEIDKSFLKRKLPPHLKDKEQ